MATEAAARADFSQIRYAQCWEDADVLLEGLNIQPGDYCLAIASAGDNALAMLTRDPAQVYAIDLNPAQLACLQLRVAAYRTLLYEEVLELVGAIPSQQRLSLYQRCRSDLTPETRGFWDQRPRYIQAGIGSAGKLERYFNLFRQRCLPLIHPRRVVLQLLQGGAAEVRQRFYHQIWNSWRWRTLFRVFFSRALMGRLGRDPAFFQYVEGNVADRIYQRTQHALTVLNPADNPYLQWILTGRYLTALPLALRPQHFQRIRQNLDRLEWRQSSLEDFLQTESHLRFQRFNLSDIFEYMSPANYQHLLQQILKQSQSGGRLVYWNMLVPRSRPESLAESLIPQIDLAQTLHQQDKAFFYSRLVVEEVA
jgi:S-adenosylmethionine-diacylglycerol 3-amino-3-carboxypropyl transferase